jgi:hypothetical protein
MTLFFMKKADEAMGERFHMKPIGQDTLHFSASSCIVAQLV